MQFTNLVNALKATASRNEKIKILQDFKEDNKTNRDIVKAVINFVYDPQVTFGQKYKIEYAEYTSEMYKDYGIEEILCSVLPMLADRRVTGAAALDLIDEAFKFGTAEGRTVLKCALEKSFGAGVDEKTIRKVFPGVLPVKINMMKCEPMNEKSIKVIEWPARMELKIDAMRVNAIVGSEGNIEFITYNGTRFDIENPLLKSELYNIAKECHGMGFGDWPYYLDGELVIRDVNLKFLPRKTSNGLANRILKGTAPKEVHLSTFIVLWDVICQQDMELNISEKNNKERFQILQDVIRNQETEWCEEVSHKIVNNLEEANGAVEFWISRGEEGGVLKNLNAKWEGKRSKHCIKFKAEKEADMIVTGWIPGDPTGKRAGGIGALICESIEGMVRVDVGGGLDDEDVFSDPSDWVGRIVTVRFNEVISSKSSDVKSLFLPRIVEKRVDKDFPDSASVIESL